MYTKVLILKFENSGVFFKHWRQNKKTNTMMSGSKDDRILTPTSREIRTPDQWIDNGTKTLHVSFVENVLRVLVGKRPVPKYRKAAEASREDVGIAEIAKRCGVQILSFTDKKKSGEDTFVYERMTTRKSLDNSWGIATPTWEKMYRLLPPELFMELVEVAKDICNSKDPTSILFADVAEKLFESKDPRIDDLIKKARVARAEPLAKLLSGNPVHSLQQAGFNGLGPYLRTLVVKGVSSIARIDGKICVPITDQELELFKNGGGFATLMEGGVVTIDRVIDLEYTTAFNATMEFSPVEVS